MKNLVKIAGVRKFGFVDRFEKQGIEGQVKLPRDSDGEQFVELFINETLVLKSLVVPDVNRVAKFKIGVYDVWRFAQRSDRVAVKFHGTALPMPSGELYAYPAKDGKENLAALHKRFAQGQAFDAEGKIKHLPKDLDHTWQNGVLSLYQVVSQVIKSVTTADSFIYSGTLLGYVRNSGFIPHDKDMDCAYVSKTSSPQAAAEEFAALGTALIAAGYQVTPKASCISVREATGSKIMVDIAHLFVKDDETIGFPFGTVGVEPVAPDCFEPVTTGTLSGFKVGLPARTKEVVTHIYGESWHIPDPDFKWSERRRRRDAQALLSYGQRSQISMDDYYSRDVTTEPSAFAEWLVGSGIVPHMQLSVDVGCGNGRDLASLLQLSDNVCGVERSAYAVAAARKLCDSTGQIEIVDGDFLVPGTLGRVAENESRNSMESVLFYHRLVLNGLTVAEESVLISELASAANHGDFIAFEHRTDEDASRKKALFRSFRRFIPVAETVGLLEKYGMAIVHCESAGGLAPFGREDPHVVRIVAKRV